MTRSRASYRRTDREATSPRDAFDEPRRGEYNRSGRSYGEGPERREFDSGRAERSAGRSRRPTEWGSGGGGGRGPSGPSSGGSPSGGPGLQLNVFSVAVLAGALVVGIGIGSAVTSTTQGNQGNIASAQQLDMAVPDPEFCKQWGASAFVMDIELYTTMNPSSSFVTQPTLQPGCVIRRENWAVLQKQGAVTSEQMRECKQRMNTFAYIGSVRDKPVVRCVYQTDISGNKFQTRGVAGAADDSLGLTPEGDQF